MASPKTADIRPPFDQMAGQELAARYLSAASSQERQSQAYLFFGAPGSGKTQAALLLAQALLCRQGGHDGCDDCRRVARQIHPDLHQLSPAGASGYLSEQMQDLAREASLAPISSARKVYIISQADRMSSSFANAFLKILEEPVESVVFILIANRLESLLPTIRSRCQVIPFGILPEEQTVELLAAELGVDVARARLALALGQGHLDDARSFLRSESRHALRRDTLQALRGLPSFDSLDVLEAAKNLMIAMKLPLDELKASQGRELETARDSLSKSALTSLEQRQKRQLSAAERAGVRWLIQVVRTWLRDILLVALGGSEAIVNYDEQESIRLFAASSGLTGLMACLDAAREAQEHLDYNVSVQSILEFLLFTLRDELGRRN